MPRRRSSSASEREGRGEESGEDGAIGGEGAAERVLAPDDDDEDDEDDDFEFEFEFAWGGEDCAGEVAREAMSLASKL